MFGAWGYYITTLLVYFGVNALSALSLNLQFGYAGIVNFSYIIFQSLGAYVAAILVLGPSSQSFQKYVFGATLPFPIPLLAATVAGAALAAVVGTFTLRRIRRDYQAAILLIISLIAVQVVSSDATLFNGANGLTGVSKPLFDQLNVSLQTYQWLYVVWVAVLVVLVYFVVQWLCRSSWGRSLRAMRDQEDAAAAMGVNITVLRMQVFIIGGAIAGLSGGLLVEFIGAWSPGAWGYVETFVIFTAMFVGGIRNNLGVVLGALLVPTVLLELPRFLPVIGYPGLMDSVQWIVIGLLWMGFLYLRPRGLVPERRHLARDPIAAAPDSEPGVGSRFGRSRSAAVAVNAARTSR